MKNYLRTFLNTFLVVFLLIWVIPMIVSYVLDWSLADPFKNLVLILFRPARIFDFFGTARTNMNLFLLCMYSSAIWGLMAVGFNFLVRFIIARIRDLYDY